MSPRPLFLVTRLDNNYTVARFLADDPTTLLAAVQARARAGQMARASIVPGNDAALLMLLEVSAENAALAKARAALDKLKTMVADGGAA